MHNPHNEQNKKQAQNNAGSNAAAHSLHILRTVALSRNNSKAVAETNRQHHREHEQRRHRSHGSQSIHANRPPDNNNIGNIIQLLKNISYQKRHHKGNNQL